MHLHSRNKNDLPEASGSAGVGLLDALPTVRGERAARGWPWLAARLLGALALLATGAVHLQQFDRFYSEIPTIGTLFVLNFAGATALALGLLAPLERLFGRRGSVLLALLALAGIALATTAFAFLLISEHTPLFGFKEPGYDPPAIAAARGSEVAVVVFLGVFLTGRFWLKAATPRW